MGYGSIEFQQPIIKQQNKKLNMGFFSKLAKTAPDTALLPVEIVKDAATLGGLTTDKREPYTVTKLKHIGDDIEDVRDSLDD